MEDKKTRRQENKMILMRAENVGGKSNVLYSRIPVFLSSPKKAEVSSLTSSEAITSLTSLTPKKRYIIHIIINNNKK